MDRRESSQIKPEAPSSLDQPSVVKKEKARKRNFSDIVDSTEDQSDGEDERHRPKPRSDLDAPGTSVQTGVLDSQQVTGLSPRMSQRDHIRNEVVAQPMDKRRDALRRSTYNPRTICRDVLVSSGRHPSMAPLSHHLDILRERFRSIDFETDLSTLRWDIIDPGGDPPPDLRRGTMIATSPEKPEPSRRIPVKERASLPKAVKVEINTTHRRENAQGMLNGLPNSKLEPPTTGNQTRSSADHRRSGTSNTDPAAMIRSYTFASEAPSSQPAKPFVAPAKPPDRYGREPGRIGRPPGAKNKKPRTDKGVPKKQFASNLNNPSVPRPSPSKLPQQYLPWQ